MKTNVFFHGDCLFVMKHDIPAESVDLIYLDPPFFTGRVQKPKNHDKICENYGWDPSVMQISYEDSKKFWKEKGIHEHAPEWLKYIGLQRPDFASYLFYMMERLQECKRILKSTGSIYLHCDWRANHYLKMIMDEIFGYKNFKNDIAWLRTNDVGYYKANASFFAHNQDNILFYTKTNNYFFNNTLKLYSGKYKDKFNQNDNDEKGPYYWENLSFDSEKGIEIIRKPKDELKQRKSGLWSYKRYLSSLEKSGTNYHDIWVDIYRVKNPLYPTQKPITLLERIILASSKPKDIVFDPFCGCGSSVVTAHNLDREWIGIDINNVAIKVIEDRCVQLKIDNPLKPIIVERNLENVMAIVNEESKGKGYKFERWVNEFYNARKPIDKGVDGITSDGIPIQTKTFKINDTIVNGFYGQAMMHKDVPKPLKTIRLVSGIGFNDNARQARFEIENKSVKVELFTPEDMLKEEQK